jgi:hypothetical protein
VPAFNYELAATVLVDAIYRGDEAAAQAYGVSTRSIRRWRERLHTDPRLATFVQTKREVAERNWSDSLAGAIRAGVEFLQRAARELDPANPEAVHAAAGALKILTEIAMTREVLSARLARSSGDQDT